MEPPYVAVSYQVAGPNCPCHHPSCDRMQVRLIPWYHAGHPAQGLASETSIDAGCALESKETTGDK